MLALVLLVLVRWQFTLAVLVCGAACFLDVAARSIARFAGRVFAAVLAGLSAHVVTSLKVDWQFLFGA
jgi:hypothetical protein